MPEVAMERKLRNWQVLLLDLTRANRLLYFKSERGSAVPITEPTSAELFHLLVTQGKPEGVSTVYKSTPPNLDGEKRLAKGYPAITASVVNTRVPGICYANWFSYKTADFISQNREIQRAIRTPHWVFPNQRIRFVMDSGGDDQKVFAWMNQPTASSSLSPAT